MGSDTRVLSGSSCFYIIVYHCCCGPYHARLPKLVVALLMYIHIFLLIGDGGVSTGFAGIVGFYVLIV
jgi:hypothetical protein